MAEETRRDMTVNGGGTVPAGTYEVVTINGGGTISGDITCTTLRINGAASCDGAVKAAAVTVNGAATFNGLVHVTEMSINGQTTVRGGLGVGRLSVKGSLSVDGGVGAREIDLRGILRTDGDITAESITGEGAFSARNVTSASVDFAVYGQSTVSALEGSRIVLRSPRSFAELFSVFTTNSFNADSIRASEVWLENTVAGVVAAGNATIGDDCRIGLVHYSGTYEKRGNAQVTEERPA